MRGDAHVRFGGRAEETDRSKDRHRASVRPLPATPNHPNYDYVIYLQALRG